MNQYQQSAVCCVECSAGSDLFRGARDEPNLTHVDYHTFRRGCGRFGEGKGPNHGCRTADTTTAAFNRLFIECALSVVNIATTEGGEQIDRKYCEMSVGHVHKFMRFMLTPASNNLEEHPVSPVWKADELQKEICQ